MSPAEFRAWLEGFAESVNGAPTPEQWQTILGKMSSVTSGEKQPPINAPKRAQRQVR